ncbi:hypothetical protein ACFC18_51830 [Streptomyces sp. NPDC056121]
MSDVKCAGGRQILSGVGAAVTACIARLHRGRGDRHLGTADATANVDADR